MRGCVIYDTINSDHDFSLLIFVALLWWQIKPFMNRFCKWNKNHKFLFSKCFLILWLLEVNGSKVSGNSMFVQFCKPRAFQQKNPSFLGGKVWNVYVVFLVRSKTSFSHNPESNEENSSLPPEKEMFKALYLCTRRWYFSQRMLL